MPKSNALSGKTALLKLLEEKNLRLRERFELYQPYDQQKAFHAAGKEARERMFLAGNQLGKTLCAAYETAMHLTGAYPDWWPGRRFSGAVTGWAASLTAEVTRDNIENRLVGLLGRESDGESSGPGGNRPILTSRQILGCQRAAGGHLDRLFVRHRSGGVSVLQFKSFAQGRESWQGSSLDFVWMDEEPPLSLYLEGLTRVHARRGLIYLTLTPLLGMTDLMLRFLGEEAKGISDGVGRAVQRMTLKDVSHYSTVEKKKIRAAYPEYQREARADGQPLLGSGRIFTLPEEKVSTAPFEPPGHWPVLGGIDFGWDHPTAAVKLVWDRDKDCVYITRAYRARKATPRVHAKALRAFGRRLVWIWPQDGLQHEKGSGRSLAMLFREAGMHFHPEPARFPDGSNSLEAGVLLMQQRLWEGKLKVFADLDNWFEEYRLYHRKNGLIVKVRDDLLSATRYALMGLRFARTERAMKVKRSGSDPPFDPLAWRPEVQLGEGLFRE